MRDHLGNTRVVFTTDPKTFNFRLNYESNTADPDDEAFFDNLQSVIAADVHDRVDAANESFNHDKVQLLNGATNGVIGSVLTVPVGQGDKISAEVYAKYLAPTGTNNPTAAIGSLLTAALTGGTSLTGYESSINSSFGTTGNITGLVNSNASSTEPMAFINLLFLPENVGSSVADSHFAFKQITSASSNNHAILALDEPYEAPESGYVVVYLSNESAQLTEVYFDDLKITVDEHPVIEKQDFYPFGLAFNEYQRVTAKENRFKFNQGTGDKQFRTERVTDLGLNIDMTKYRTYDYTTGRFMQIDPLADAAGQESLTSYQFSFNNPIRYNDPLGDCPTCDPYFNAGFLKGAFNAVKSTVTSTLDLLSLANNPAAQVNAAVSTVSTVQAIADNPGAVVDAVVDGVTETANTLVNGTSFQQGELIGAGAVAVAGSILGDKGVSKLKTVSKITNAIPDKVARVISKDDVASPATLGRPGADDVFVTDPADIKGLDSKGIADKLTIPESQSGFHVIEFNTPSGIASPVNRTNPGFVGRGRTAGGAKEFVVPNQKIPKDAKKKIIE